LATARRHIAIIVVLLLGAVAAQVAHIVRKSPAQYTPGFDAVPMELGAYKGDALSVDQSIYRFLAADAMIERRYVAKDGTVKLSLIYGSDWRSLHSPAGCYPAQGWQIVTDEQLTVPAPPDSPTSAPLQARLLRVRKSKIELLAMFTFCYPGGTTGQWAEQGWKVATGPRGAGGIVISLIMPTGGNLAEARQRLKWFLQQVYPHAVKFWYQDENS